MTGPTLLSTTVCTPKRRFTSSATLLASSSQSPWLMKTVWPAGSMAVSAMWSTRALRDALRPRAVPTFVRWPSSSTCMTGLMDSMVPSTAVAEEMRPPRLRKWRSSTVNQWHR